MQPVSNTYARMYKYKYKPDRDRGGGGVKERPSGRVAGVVFPTFRFISLDSSIPRLRSDHLSVSDLHYHIHRADRYVGGRIIFNDSMFQGIRIM